MSQENVTRGVRYPVSLPNERASQRRTLDERLFVRFPALYRLFAERVIRQKDFAERKHALEAAGLRE